MSELRTVMIRDMQPMNSLCGGDVQVRCWQATGEFVCTLKKKMVETLAPLLVTAFANREPITLKVEEMDMSKVGAYGWEVVILDVVYL